MLPTRRPAFRPLVAAIGLALTAASAQAQLVSTQSITATGANTYGTVADGFGSASSGSGVYDVSGAFSLIQSVTNNTASAQRATFYFFVVPGLLQNDVRSNLGTADYVASGIQFGVKVNGNSVWGSQADLSTNASGTTFNLSGANLYTSAVPLSGGNATIYTIAGGLIQVDLGVIAAGQTISLEYDLQTYAKGSASGLGSFTSPQQSVTVPDRVVFVPEQRYAVQDENGDSHEVVIPAYNDILPGYETIVGGQTLADAASGSVASSGAPFELNADGSVRYLPREAGHLPSGVVFSAVPEAETTALALAGLTVLGLVARRRRAQA